MSSPTTSTAEGLLVRPFDTVLVANRGEIACRVIRSARDAGYRTVAVHSDVDAGAPHVLLADEAVEIGPAPARESYLRVDGILEAAERTGADAIHPGYGFLSENAGFARACHDAGIVFIGPPPEAIELMGDKAAAKRRAEAAGVPLLPGYQGDQQDDDTLIAEAGAVGFPLMVKASAGGGGKGMRLVTGPDDLPDAIAAARREAQAAFGDDTLLLERALIRPRHVEIQVMADAHGNVIALGERDCSVQRRHQKVVEEAPAPGLSEQTRAAMQAAAVAAARDIGYVGAGTVEFLLDTADGASFSFLEMNTRLQVEHPVTELVTGLDLVDLQLRVASGQPLPIGQDDVELQGHAIEVRLYAEDPASGYLPQVGTIIEWVPPSGEGVRVDAGITSGQRIGSDYDPMLAKIIAHGRDRDEARRRLVRALERTILLGVRSNRTFLIGVLEDSRFADGEVTTAYLDDHDVTATEPTSTDLALIAARLHVHHEQAAAHRSPGLVGWSNAASPELAQLLRWEGDECDVGLRRDGDRLHIEVGPVRPAGQAAGGPVADAPARFVVTAQVGDPDVLAVDGHRRPFHARLERTHTTHRILLSTPTLDLDVRDALLLPAEQDGVAGAGVLVAPMHGAVVSVSAAVGDKVVEGQPLVVMEAMKMEHVISADVDGVVDDIVSVGDQIADGDAVARIMPAEPDPSTG